MLSKAQEKQIRALHRKKGREQSGLCLVEGQNIIDAAGDAVEFIFTPQDSNRFEKLVTTKSPRNIAGVARTPEWSMRDIASRPTTVVLDYVQDPGNVGAILRLALGFDASLVLIESADAASPKVVRSSAGAVFKVPWVKVERKKADDVVQHFQRPVFRLENTESAKPLNEINQSKEVLLIAGSEGRGILLNTDGVPVKIEHNPALESLNVANAVAIALYKRFSA